MVHTAKKKIRKHRGVEESPLNNDVLNTILLVTKCNVFMCLYVHSFIIYAVPSVWQVLDGDIKRVKHSLHIQSCHWCRGNKKNERNYSTMLHVRILACENTAEGCICLSEQWESVRAS